MNNFEKKRKEIELLLQKLKNKEQIEKALLNNISNNENIKIIPIDINYEKNKIYDWETDIEINPDFELWEKELSE
jgi:hypothetical protein